jgi:predicted transcriptional regulator
MPGDAMLLALKPRWADAILRGVKTAEVRRSAPRARPGTPVLLYASSPVQRVVGACIIASVDEATPAALWERHGPSTGLDCQSFSEYLDGARRPGCLLVTEPTRIAPTALAGSPPQSYRWITARDGELVALVASVLPSRSSEKLSPNGITT